MPKTARGYTCSKSVNVIQDGTGDTKKPRSLNQGFFVKNQDGGEGGIRTLDTLRYTHFPGVLLRPLGHLTTYALEAGCSAPIT